MSIRLLLALVFLSSILPGTSRCAFAEHPQAFDSRVQPTSTAPVPSSSITPRKTSTRQVNQTRPQSLFSPWKLFGGLAVTIAVLVGGLKYLQTFGPLGGARSLPDHFFEVLGVKALSNRHSIYFTRVGGKLLVLASTGESLSVLTEITDPIDVASLLQPGDEPPAKRNRGQQFADQVASRLANEEPTSQSQTEDQARRELTDRLSNLGRTLS